MNQTIVSEFYRVISDLTVFLLCLGKRTSHIWSPRGAKKHLLAELKAVKATAYKIIILEFYELCLKIAF